MGELQPFTDPTGQMSETEIIRRDLDNLLREWNRGADASTIRRRALTPSQFKILSYHPDPIQLLNAAGGGSVGAGASGYRALNFTNNGLTNSAGQTFLPVFYVDLFVDPADTSSTSALYATGADFPTGGLITAGMLKLNFNWYLRNSTPGTDADVVSYVLEVTNNDAGAHAYWVSVQLLLPADGNLNPGGTAAYLP